MVKVKEDLTGKRFGKLLVLYQAEDHISKNGEKCAMWHCLCDCGKEVDVLQKSLKSGNTKSCGCLNKAVNSLRMKEYNKQNKKYNEYDLTGEYGIGYTFKGEEFYFDLEDYDKIKNYCWCIRHSANKHSDGTVDRDILKVLTNTYNDDGSRKTILLHQLILETDDNHVPDHIDGNGLDNRKSNLRITTMSQNAMNRKLAHNNTSNVTGVDYVKAFGKWRARLRVNGETHYLGYYVNKEDAVKARKEAEEKYFGEFSYDNSRINNTKQN